MQFFVAKKYHGTVERSVIGCDAGSSQASSRLTQLVARLLGSFCSIISSCPRQSEHIKFVLYLCAKHHSENTREKFIHVPRDKGKETVVAVCWARLPYAGTYYTAVKIILIYILNVLVHG